MTVIPFTGRTRAPEDAAAPPPVVATGVFRSPSGRVGTFLGTYRLERCPSPFGQPAAAGVFAGQLADVDGGVLGTGSRRTTVAVHVVTTASALLVQLGPLDVNLLGLLVRVDELAVDVRGTCCEDDVRAALGVSDQPPGAASRLLEHLPALRPSRRPVLGRPSSAPTRPGPAALATAGERQELLRERRLLQDVLALVRRCDACPPAPLLDAVLDGTSAARPALPWQPGPASRLR